MASHPTPTERYATPASLRAALVDFQNRSLNMVPRAELETLQRRLADTPGGDVRTRLLLKSVNKELKNRL